MRLTWLISFVFGLYRCEHLKATKYESMYLNGITPNKLLCQVLNQFVSASFMMLYVYVSFPGGWLEGKCKCNKFPGQGLSFKHYFIHCFFLFGGKINVIFAMYQELQRNDL